MEASFIKKALNDEKAAYEAIKQRKEKFGVFYKTCFHVHTPESYDYKLKNDWDKNRYIASTDQEIFELCIRRNVFPSVLKIEDFEPIGVFCDYNSRKEVLSFLLLAEELIVKDVEIVVVSDHHTIQGVPKLEIAIKHLCQMKNRNTYPEVILGVEISCADKNHVVGVFESSDENNRMINNWLKDNLLNIEEGTYETSREVLQFINSFGGIGYLAHLDTSNVFKEQFLNRAYKQKLFSNETLHLVGLSDYNNHGYIKSRVMKYRSNEIKFLIDNDAHDLESVGNKCFWIKGSKRNFITIKEALSDYDISISFKEEKSDRQYIKGIYIENCEDGFLSGICGKDNFCLNFSGALNCLIGGRGAGKSSVLEILEYVLSQRCESEKLLDFICAHGNTWVLYDFQGDEYLIEMRMPFKQDNGENILRYFGQNQSDRYQYSYRYSKESVEEFALKQYMKISKVTYRDGDLWLETIPNKKEMLKKFFDTRYSVNELVNTASGEQINKFLYEVLLQNRTLARPADVISVRSKSGLRKILSDVKGALQLRQEAVNTIIRPFNANQQGILRIVYSQRKIPNEPDLGRWIFGMDYKEESLFHNYNITKGNVIGYLLNLYDKNEIFDFLDMVISKKSDKAKQLINILGFCTDMNQNLIDKGIYELNSDNSSSLIKTIFSELITDDNLNNIIYYLRQYIQDIEEFSLEFNLNNKESNNRMSPFYKDVRILSLGQKVVAMLSFILGFSEYSKDYRPLIIDQPEDNLDNLYIYRNLVKQLRGVKEKRQVIIATHSATIVTNAKADQVCVMVSDDKHGWIDRTGYPGENGIKNQIINYLEGGKDSFIHKLSVYEEALELVVKKKEDCV
ncbi:putative ATPase [Desulfitobacterium dichloroeliminans LMG P-21439]|uniref:Putative ATPase n=1 Tax=Desulfitobacterium dichloroeliminans (strain LMG P-21439 / DCA1) TaxID=871963 RepID=L0F476_DESDL|nr:AAA family ATPase [Desulfitobacterium dichloroeliminans]AGA67860.1 putative ATPase [Desulfitobacterium dichloroeliminans LMG P-21439]